MKIIGSPRFGQDTLAATIVTQGGGRLARWFGIGTVPCVDSLEVDRDAIRIAVLHRQAGWFTATVLPQIAPSKDGVHVTFAVIPGPEATLDSLHITGVPKAPGGRAPYDEALRNRQGRIFDRVAIAGAIEDVMRRMHEAGYARAVRGDTRIRIDTASAKVSMDVGFVANTPATLGEVSITVDGIGDHPASADSADVLHLLDLRSGQAYRASGILEAQRDLYRSEAFRFVQIDTVAPHDGQPDSLLNLRIVVAEARTRSARTGLGWATQDCIRAQGRLTNRSFLGIGRRAELNLRASKIARGAPADFAPSLCAPSVRRDTLASSRLNYFAGLSLTDTKLFGTNIVPVFTVYSERRGEQQTYLRETTIGTVLELTKQFGRRVTGTAGAQYENGRTINDPVVSCSRFAQCRPEDYALSQFGRGVVIASTSATYDRTNDPVNPNNGGRLRGEGRVGDTFSKIASSVVFYRTTMDASVYRRFAGGVIATRMQLSRIFAPGAQLVDGTPLIPQQERLYSGGQNSVRGYQQNLLGPVIYKVADVQTDTLPSGDQVIRVRAGAGFERAVPRGGTGLIVANLEYRRALPVLSGGVQLAAFVDAGSVWESQSTGFRAGDVRATPGLGVRVATPLGPFRLDIGYQPYAPRPGRALYFTPGANGAIYCASPGNTVGVSRLGQADIFTCPETYRPPRGGVLSHLVFHFGLGQAF